MTKMKKEEEKQEVNTTHRLSPEQYWEWRTVIAEMETAKLKMELERRNVLIAQQDMQIRQHMLKEIKINLEEAVEEYSDRRNGYMTFTEQLEKELGCSFRGKIIHPITFEIMDENTPRIPEEEGR